MCAKGWRKQGGAEFVLAEMPFDWWRALALWLARKNERAMKIYIIWPGVGLVLVENLATDREHAHNVLGEENTFHTKRREGDINVL